MKELTELQKNMRNWAEGVTITFSKKKNAIKYVITEKTSDQLNRTKEWAHIKRLTLESEAQLSQNGKVLMLLPFEYGKTRGATDIQDSLEAVLYYWVHYAKLHGIDTIAFAVSTVGDSLGGAWSEGEKIITAVRFGFRVESVEPLAGMRRSSYRMVLPVAEYQPNEEIIKRIEKEFAVLSTKDKTMFWKGLNLSVGEDVVKVCKESIPFYVRRITWFGFDGYICFEGIEGKRKVCLYSGVDAREMEFVFETMFTDGEETQAIVGVIDYIRDTQKMKNLIETPKEALKRYFQGIHRASAEELAVTVMDGLVALGHDFMDIEREISEVLAGHRMNEKGSLWVGGYANDYLEIAECFVLIRREIGEKDKSQVYLFPSKREMTDFVKDTVEAELYNLSEIPQKHLLQ